MTQRSVNSSDPQTALSRFRVQSYRLTRLSLLVCLAAIACSPAGPSSEATSAPSTAPTSAPTATAEPSATAGPSASGVLVITTPPPSPTPSPTKRPTAAPTPVPTAPAIAKFTAPATVSCTGGEVVQITLSWQVERAAGVTLSIDGPGKYDDYPATATVEVPFACGEPQHTYTITSIGGSGPAATQTKTIKRA